MSLRQERWRHAKSIAVYYGREPPEQLSSYDALIVEPLGWSKEAITRVKQQGPLLLAYLSVMECNCTAWEMPHLRSQDFLRRDGQPIVHPQYGGYLMDLRSPHWQRSLMYRASNLLALGYDGLFLDTIGDLEDHQWPALLQTELLGSATRLVSRLKATYPGCLLIQNNGLTLLAPKTFAHVDGFCWENPPVDQCQPDRLDVLLERIGRQTEDDLPRLLLLFEDAITDGPQTHHSVATQLNQWATKTSTLIYHAPRDYLQIATPTCAGPVRG